MTEQDLFEVVCRHIQEVLPDVEVERIQLDHNMRELGANSIDRMDVVIGVQDELGIGVPSEALSKVHNLRSLVAVLQVHL